MNPWFTLRIAAVAILRNKVRSLLTALGIIIGVGAVIAMMAVGEGAKKVIEQQFSAMGTNLLIILPGSSTSGGARSGSGTLPSLTWDDLKAIQALSSVAAAAPSLRTSATVVTEDLNWSTVVYGTTPEFFVVRNWPVASGVAMQRSDVDGGLKIVILGATVVEKLYGRNANPVGLSVRIRNIPFQVVGVAATKGQSAQGQDYDDAVFIPATTFMAKIQNGLLSYINGQIIVAATSAQTVTKAQDDVTDLLRDRHGIVPGKKDDDFSIRNLAEIASAQEEGANTMTTLLAAVAAVSLVVGGIGIMNIMLVSVSERTHEIGIRIAIGAKARDILAQFMIEALSLSVAGGILGVTIGVAVAKGLAYRNNWPILIRGNIVAVSLGFSLLVGVVFGLYPAWKAAKMDPIQALRTE
jgi:putative ABC transport system permease protein